MTRSIPQQTAQPEQVSFVTAPRSEPVQRREERITREYEPNARGFSDVRLKAAQRAVRERLHNNFQYRRQAQAQIRDDPVRWIQSNLPYRGSQTSGRASVGFGTSSAEVPPTLSVLQDQGSQAPGRPDNSWETEAAENHDIQQTTEKLQRALTKDQVEAYTNPFLNFITDNPTVFHAVHTLSIRLEDHGFIKLSARQSWNDQIKKGGKYFLERNGSSAVAFVIGTNYEPGNGAAVIAAHIDALTTKVKPIPTKSTTAGYVQLGIAPYAGALNKTWWDRDLGIGGRVLVKDSTTGKIETKLVKIGHPIARIPTLAPHFGAPASEPHPNPETQMVPIIGLDNSDLTSRKPSITSPSSLLGGAGTFTATQPERLVKAIAGELNIQDYSTIINWELEVFDTQPAQLGGLDKEFIFAPRIDDKLCSFAAIEALLASTSESTDDGILKIVGCFDDEEIGSLLRQGAKGNFLPSTIERILSALAPNHQSSADLVAQTYANSFMISADVSHAVNPNYLSVYLENHAPRLNVGIAVQADPNGHTTTDSVSTAFLQRVADKCDSKLQVFQIRNDSRSGGTVGPMLSSAMGMRAIDAGLPQLSMHSIRATVGNLDPGLGVKLFKGFFDHFEEVDAEFT